MKTKISRPVVRACTKLSSWLRACKIEHRVLEDYTIKVKESSGFEKHLMIGTESENVPLKDFWTPKTKIALDTFANLTESLGYGRMNPLSGREKAKESPDYIDFWMRHTEIKNSPNPPAKVFKDYAVILNSQVNRFCSNKDNQRLMWEVGLDEGDIHSIASAWIVSYECLHKMVISKQFDNEKILQSYLRQRFGELHNRLVSRAKKHGYQILDPEDFSNKLNTLTYFEDPLDEITEEISGQAKYRKVKAELTTRLNSIGKDKAISKLASVINNPKTPSEVVEKAKNYLRKIEDSIGI